MVKGFQQFTATALESQNDASRRSPYPDIEEQDVEEPDPMCIWIVLKNPRQYVYTQRQVGWSPTGNSNRSKLSFMMKTHRRNFEMVYIVTRLVLKDSKLFSSMISGFYSCFRGT